MTFEEIVRKSQQALKQTLITELQRMGYRTISKKGFTYGTGAVPVLLVAHLDTAHREPIQTICYSSDGKTIMSPQGIGGDDRAGVFMILRILKRRRCHVLFCEDEEIGGVGVQKFAESGIRPEVNYIIELDRRGSDDAVFYDCNNPDFTKFICGFGFEEEFGSFSDISIIAPELGIAAVNISAGYFNEHTLHETVDMTVVQKNIERVCKMVATPSVRFEYMEGVRTSKRGRYSAFDYEGWFDELYWKSSTGDSTEVQQLKSAAEQFGVYEHEVDLLLDFGYYPDEIETLLNHPQRLRKAVFEGMFGE